jgi:hypothetical protein
MIPSRSEVSSTTISDAQREMRLAYYGGAPGMLTSATVWLAAGVVAALGSPKRAVWALFIGGMFIHPVSVLLNKVIGRPGKHSRGNPFGALALTSTFWMILSLPLAYAVAILRIEWFFPAMLFVIGGRYLIFSTIFGARIYWGCGAALALAGYILARANASPDLGSFTGAAIEALFAAAIFINTRREIAVT